jgi:hypothetical protein
MEPNFFRRSRTDIGCVEEDIEFNSESNQLRFNIGVCAGREKLSPQSFPLPIHMYTYIWQHGIKKFLYCNLVFVQCQSE